MSQSAVPSDCQSPVRFGLPFTVRGGSETALFCAATGIASVKTKVNAPKKRFCIRVSISECLLIEEFEAQSVEFSRLLDHQEMTGSRDLHVLEIGEMRFHVFAVGVRGMVRIKSEHG